MEEKKFKHGTKDITPGATLATASTRALRARYARLPPHGVPLAV